MTHDREDSNKVQHFLPSTMNGNWQLLCIVILGACISIINGATVSSVDTCSLVKTETDCCNTTANAGCAWLGACGNNTIKLDACYNATDLPKLCNSEYTDSCQTAAVSATSGNDTSIATSETTVNPGTVTAGAGTTLNAQTTQPTKPGGTTQVTKPSTPAKETTQPPSKPVVSTGTTPNKPTTTTTIKPAGRKFDGPSFGGGFGLAAGLVIIFGIGYCCYTRRKSSGGYSQY